MLRVVQAHQEERPRACGQLGATVTAKICKVCVFCLCIEAQTYNTDVLIFYQVMDTELLYHWKSQLIDNEASGCRMMLKNDCKYDLARMFRLFSRVDDGIALMASTFKKHVANEVDEIMERHQHSGLNDNQAGEVLLIEELMRWCDKYYQMIQTQFEGHSLFSRALRDAFDQFIGDLTVADRLSCYCDRIMKSGTEQQHDIATDAHIVQVVQLLSCLPDQDVFADSYRNL